VSSWAGPAAAHRIKNILGSRFLPGMKVLDIGTGPGTNPLHLKKLFPETHFTLIDISSGMLRKARDYASKAGLHMAISAGDGECLPIGSGKMDGVISFFAMHHMDHPEKLLQEIDRVLKPGGILLIIDFRRDMSSWLFKTINALWQTAFFFSTGRAGFAESTRSAWRPDEIEAILKQTHIDRFRVYTNRMELWVTA
jgi:ubiquinone/menaquinone biosynthesis C-methylase UbiE